MSTANFSDRDHYIQRNRVAPDGYEYGVMFNDGSVMHPWNGATMRDQARRAASRLARQYYPDNITLARRRPGDQWERVEPTDGIRAAQEPR